MWCLRIGHGAACRLFDRDVGLVRGGVGCWRDRGGRRHAPSFHGAAGCKLKAMLRNNPASGQAAAKAMRTRVAVSVIRPAILSRRIRKVANSAVASGCDLAMASRTVSSNQ